MATRQLMDEVMFEIGTMTGQTYVDRYAQQSTTATTARATVDDNAHSS